MSEWIIRDGYGKEIKTFPSFEKAGNYFDSFYVVDNGWTIRPVEDEPVQTSPWDPEPWEDLEDV